MRFAVLILFIVTSSLLARGHFSKLPDICDVNKHKKCTDEITIVKELQRTLNQDKSLKLNIKVDGKWGKQTQRAVVLFQKKHKLKVADGIVGKETKRVLDKIWSKHKRIKRAKVAKRYRHIKRFKSYSEFRKYVNLRKSYKIYKNTKLLKRANGRNTRLKIDISEQRIRLYVDGKVALCSPCTTGAKRKFEPNTRVYRDKRTPMGTFRITEKIKYKRSTIFGDYYRGRKRVYHGDRRKFRGSKRGLRFKGASLKNWMRLTSSGIGLHASRYIKRYPGTNGCIRLPYKVANIIFKKVRRGTKVSIVR